jgi:outer membrane immunogenic protein
MRKSIVPWLSVIALVWGCATLAPGLVMAADMRVKAPLLKAPAALPSWTGFYIGATGGYGWGDSRQYDQLGDTSAGYNITGAVGGGEAGYNWQMNQIVLGLEVDISAAHIFGGGNSTTNYSCLVAGGCETNVSWFATQRARAGFLVSNSLLAYVTGGAAEARVENLIVGGTCSGCVVTTQTRTGWTAGGGLEYQFAPHVTLKAEYLYVDIAQYQWTTFLGGTDPGLSFARFGVARGGLNYRF